MSSYLKTRSRSGFFCDSPMARPQSANLGLVPAIGRSQKAVRFSPASGCVTMLFPRLLTLHTSEAMHVQSNDGQSNRSGKSLSTLRPNTVAATVFKIVDGRLHSEVLTAHSSKRFTLFAIPISLAEMVLPGQDVVIKQFIKAGAVRRAVEAAIKTHRAEIRKQFLRDFDYRYGEVDVTASPHNFVMQYELVGIFLSIFRNADRNTEFHRATCLAFRDPPRVRLKDGEYLFVLWTRIIHEPHDIPYRLLFPG